MKNKFLKWVFNKYKFQIYDLIITEFFGEIPENLKEPSLEFLSRGRSTLERFFSIQAYLLQRKSINDSKHAQFYDGAMMVSKAMLHAIRSETIEKDKAGTVTDTQEKDKTEENIKEFEKLAREKNK